MSVFGVIPVRIFPSFSRIRTEYGEILRISPYSVLMQENEGKMRTKITLNMDTFYAATVVALLANLLLIEVSTSSELS